MRPARTASAPSTSRPFQEPLSEVWRRSRRSASPQALVLEGATAHRRRVRGQELPRLSWPRSLRPTLGAASDWPRYSALPVRSGNGEAGDAPGLGGRQPEEAQARLGELIDGSLGDQYGVPPVEPE